MFAVLIGIATASTFVPAPCWMSSSAGALSQPDKAQHSIFSASISPGRVRAREGEEFRQMARPDSGSPAATVASPRVQSASDGKLASRLIILPRLVPLRC